MRLLSSLIGIIALASIGSAVERQPWTSSRVIGTPEPPRPYRTERIYPKLRLNQPVEMVALPGTNKMLLLEVQGKVFTFEDDQSCQDKHLAIDLAGQMDKMRRAYGITPHPNFANNREVFIVYAGDPVAKPDGSRLSRFRMTKSQPLTLDPESEEVLLTWHSGGHNGSCIRFDQDGYLYFSAGDGAKPYPPDEYNVGQNLSDLRSTICRIDVNGRDPGLGYAIPKDNPFIKTAGARPEIWAYGFRNPWRFSIDRKTGQMLVGDVGWELWELVFHVERSGNYGWSIFEGPQPIRSDIEPGPTPIRKPLVAYPHTDGLSVTGGFIYHGSELPKLRGAYLYGDYVTGKLWAMRFEGNSATQNEVISETGLKIISFAENRDQEVIVMGYDGTIHRLVKNESSGKPSEFPRRLSESGLFESTADLKPAPGVYPYALTASSYAEGTSSEFHVAVPGAQTIKTANKRRGWSYPVGTVFAKTISTRVSDSEVARGTRIETQLLHFNGSAWQPYSYRWNKDQSDATLVGPDGETAEIELGTETRTWKYQSRSECRACHTMQTGGAVGFDYANLNRTALFGDSLPQIEALVALGIIDKLPPKQWNVKYLVDPHDSQASLEQRARSYLALNCAHCHCRGGGGTVALELTYSNKSKDIFAIDFPVTQGDFGIGKDAKVISPGKPHQSTLYYRMATSGMGHMPKIWSRDNDAAGLAVVHDWICSLGQQDDSEIGDNDQALQTTSGALRLLNQLERNEFSQSERQDIISQATSGGDPVVRGLFERYLSPIERAERLGNNVNPAKILAMKGDPKKGRQQFLHSPALSCRNCHKFAADDAHSFGPNLGGIAKKRSPAELLESILKPSAQIEVQYRGYAVLTLDGQVVTGFKVTPDSQQDTDVLTLRSLSRVDGSAKNIAIAKDDIEEVSVQKKSLMPEGLAAEMTAQELADLLAFLASLK